MAGAQVRFRALKDQRWYFDHLEVEGFGSFGWHRILPGVAGERKTVAPASLASMLRALRAIGERNNGKPAILYTSSVEYYDDKHSPIDQVRIEPQDSGDYSIAVEAELNQFEC